MEKVEFTDKFLTDLGGWQMVKQARALCEMGRVVSAHYAPPILKGLVREGDKEFRAGLKIASATDVENICSCRESREWGTICAHSIALGLYLRAKNAASLENSVAPSPLTTNSNRGNASSVNESTNGISRESTAPPHPLMAIFSDVGDGSWLATKGAGTPIRLHFILSPNFEAAWEKNQIMLTIEVEQNNRKVLLNALDKTTNYQCEHADFLTIQKILEWTGGDLVGMIFINQKQCIEFLKVQSKSTNTTFGKSKNASCEELLNRFHSEKYETSEESNTKKVAIEFTQNNKIKFVQLTLEGSLNALAMRIQAVYEKSIITLGVHSEAANRQLRNLAEEESVLRRIRQLGFGSPHPTTGDMILKGERQILTFFAQELPRLQSGYRVTIGSRFQNITSQIERIQPRIEAQGSGEQWFDLHVSMETSDHQKFAVSDIRRLLDSGQSYVRLKDNRLAVFDPSALDALEMVISDCNPDQPQAGTYRLHQMHAGYIDAALGEGSEIRGSARWRQWASAQRHQSEIEPIDLGHLETVLRPYQKHGVYWMNFLARNGLAGILADEMGLGKTLQSLAFLSHLKRATPQKLAPILIIAPTSLLQNWKLEAQRFTPELSLTFIEGAARKSAFQNFEKQDIWITSYALLRRDIENYRGVEFSTIILDEAQHIKNPDTQNARAAFSLTAKRRFILTGTPIENSIRDLWSMMNFLMPGYLGSRKEFQERYEKPIIQESSDNHKNLISKRLKPFLLRRMKKEVCQDLPEKIEQTLYCDLTSEQLEVYGKLLEESRKQIHELSVEKNHGKAKMAMLTALLRLRQICCDLRLLKKFDPLIANPETDSAKVSLLFELLQEALDGGHRVLIFSQFVSMLHILRSRLAEEKIEYCYLDGETKDRMGEVQRFQDSNEIPVFLISLKAGGVGLNLTAADTVIHFDPWWNPAVEAQATDRAHRIGQQNVVTSYKLIARGTVEEKILRLQQKKRKLIDASLDSDEAFTESLTMNEIESLLA